MRRLSRRQRHRKPRQRHDDGDFRNLRSECVRVGVAPERQTGLRANALDDGGGDANNAGGGGVNGWL